MRAVPAVELRAATRFTLAWPVSFETGEGVTRDLSALGALIYTSVAVKAGEPLCFTIALPRRADECSRLRCCGRVVWALRRESGTELGVSFEELAFEF